jgi:hypothetical protein
MIYRFSVTIKREIIFVLLRDGVRGYQLAVCIQASPAPGSVDVLYSCFIFTSSSATDQCPVNISILVPKTGAPFRGT